MSASLISADPLLRPKLIQPVTGLSMTNEMDLITSSMVHLSVKSPVGVENTVPLEDTEVLEGGRGNRPGVGITTAGEGGDRHNRH